MNLICICKICRNLPPLLCHQCCATTTVPPVYCVTNAVLPLLCHHCCAATVVTPLLCHECCATTTMPSLLCHHWCATTAVPTLLCHHCCATTAVATVPPLLQKSKVAVKIGYDLFFAQHPFLNKLLCKLAKSADKIDCGCPALK